MPLIGSAAHDSVVLASRADLALEATAHGDGGIRLRQCLTFDDVPTTYDTLGTVGTSGLFALRMIGKARRLDLGPTVRRLSDDDRALTGFREATVPQGGGAGLPQSAYPALRRRVHLRCFDGSVTLPEPPPPRLVLTIASPQPSTLHLGWAWAYGAARYPLHPATEALRDPEAEAAVWRRVEETLGGGFDLQERTELSGAATLRFARDRLPMLEASEEVIVEAAELPAYREIEDIPLVTVGASESDDPDWFDLAIRVRVEGREVPFAPLFAALARGEEYLVLDNGSYLRTDLAVLGRLRELIDEARRLEDRPGPLRLNRYAASLWGDFEDVADVVEQADRWRESVGALAALARDGIAPVSEELPATVKAELRPYRRRRSTGWPSCTATVLAASSPTTWGWARPSRCWPCSSTSGRRGPMSAARRSWWWRRRR